MKTFKTLMALLLALALMCTLFVPVFATGDNAGDGEGEGGDNGGSTGSGVADQSEQVDVTDPMEGINEQDLLGEGVIKDITIEPVRVLDYTKGAHLAYIKLDECARIKWYIITEEGCVFNFGATNEHHTLEKQDAYEIKWNALDVNGKHPAGAWNAPATLRLSLVVIATGINGDEETKAVWFNYSWFDGESGPANAAAANCKSGSLPHTGL